VVLANKEMKRFCAWNTLQQGKNGITGAASKRLFFMANTADLHFV
jgi:hypothetical protein